MPGEGQPGPNFTSADREKLESLVSRLGPVMKAVVPFQETPEIVAG